MATDNRSEKLDSTASAMLRRAMLALARLYLNKLCLLKKLTRETGWSNGGVESISMGYAILTPRYACIYADNTNVKYVLSCSENSCVLYYIVT